MFPEGFKNEVQVMSHALCYDGVTNADVTAMIAASLRPHQRIPFSRRDGRGAHRPHRRPAGRRSRRDDSANESRLDLVVAGHKDGICMVEAGAKQLPESDMINALEMAHDVIREIATCARSCAPKAGKPAQSSFRRRSTPRSRAPSRATGRAMRDVIFTSGKHERTTRSPRSSTRSCSR
jgi:polyribonucleotide nucleotidyltransferase